MMNNPPWVNILKRVHYPLNVCVLDFETYFDTKSGYDLRKLSTIEYLADPRFSIVGMASLLVRALAPYTDIAAASHFWATPERAERHLRWLQHEFGSNLEHCTIVVQNGFFDLSILARKFGIRPAFVVDVIDLANNLYPGHKNSLAVLCKRFGLKSKGDTKQFSGYNWVRHRIGIAGGSLCSMPEFSRPMSKAIQQAMINYACNDAEREFELFTLMLPRIANPKFELALASHTHKLFVEPRIGLDFSLANEIVAAMGAELRGLLDKAGCDIQTIRSQKPFKKLLQKSLGDEPIPMKLGKCGRILALAKTDPEREQMLEHPNEQVRALVSARIGAKSWPTHIKRVKSMISQARAGGGVLPIGLKYYGAHTGRWSGTEGINPQNLGARSEQALVNRVRNLLVPPGPGLVFVITDASQVEARVTGWVAEDSVLTNMFAEKRPVYCEFAAGATGKLVRKPQPSDPIPVQKHLKFWRQFGKVGILGCGYGMGWAKLQDYGKNAYKIDLSEDLSRRAVSHYRKTFHDVPRFWRRLEQAFIFVTRYPHEMKMVGHLRLYHNGESTVIILPNGRELYYHHAAIKRRPDKHGRMRDAICWPHPIEPRTVWAWGGFLTENVVQAISRDILGEAILLTEKHHRVIHHVHDEIIGLVKREHAEQALKTQTKILARQPTWASDCPLDAEGFIAERYGK